MSFSFDGTNDRIDWAAVTNLTGSALTISAWVYSDGVASNADYVFNIQNAADNSYGIIMSLVTDRTAFFYRVGSTQLRRSGYWGSGWLFYGRIGGTY